jgi:hypothetical protein
VRRATGRLPVAAAAEPLFREEQRFGSGSFRALLAAGSLAALGGIALLAGRLPSRGQPAPAVALAAVAVTLLVTWWLSMAVRLVTEVRRDGLFIRLQPLHRVERRIPFEEAIRLEAVSYSPLREYGGWGLRRGRSGPAYSAWGDRGVLLTFADGRTVLLGSQRAEQLAAALRALKGPPTGAR